MRKILLVEPNMLLANLYSTALQTTGHTVYIAANAQEGLFLIEQKKPDVVLLELDMPAHNGLEFLYEFCSYTDWSSIKVIINTSQRALLYERMKVNWSDLGVSVYLYKPEVSLRNLQLVVQNI